MRVGLGKKDAVAYPDREGGTSALIFEDSAVLPIEDAHDNDAKFNICKICNCCTESLRQAMLKGVNCHSAMFQVARVLSSAHGDLMTHYLVNNYAQLPVFFLVSEDK